MRIAHESISTKIEWRGTIISIQPRTRVWRYWIDNRTHYHLGYNLFLEEEGKKQYVVAISEKQQQKEMFGIGDMIQGTAWTKMYEEREFADYYRAGALKVLKKADTIVKALPPPWVVTPPPLTTYEERGARILSKSQWEKVCFQCVWANMANVEIQWDFDRDIKKYRFESFCYGPKSCKNYKMGRAPTVPYKGRGSAVDDGGLNEVLTESRGWDE